VKILFVASEAYPLIKTGGLGDVCGSLPPALIEQGADLRLLLPAYPEARDRTGALIPIARLSLSGVAATLLEGQFPGTALKVWLLDHPPSWERAGGPYLDPLGRPWDDNAARFALLCRAACEIGLGRAGLDWRPDLVHGHDWQAGLVPALLSMEAARPATLFTVHNLAYQGVFPRASFGELALPSKLWTPEGLEFHGQLSFIKGGVGFADRLNTVSPTYAREICTPEFGCGLDGLLRHRGDRLSGILNGIDTRLWNPQNDPYLNHHYSADDLAGKRANKIALQSELGLNSDPGVPLAGFIGRLVHQKGVDLLLAALPQLDTMPLQIAVLGSGDAEYEQRLHAAAASRPGRMSVLIGYDEQLAHRIQAGSDFLLMPSRFEPCGLTQLHALRYGTVPIVHRVGGLSDTVVEEEPQRWANGDATGFLFDDASPEQLVAAITRAVTRYRDRPSWRQLVVNGMRQDHSWGQRALDYLDLYRHTLSEHASGAGRPNAA